MRFLKENKDYGKLTMLIRGRRCIIDNYDLFEKYLETSKEYVIRKLIDDMIAEDSIYKFNGSFRDDYFKTFLRASLDKNTLKSSMRRVVKRNVFNHIGNDKITKMIDLLDKLFIAEHIKKNKQF